MKNSLSKKQILFGFGLASLVVGYFSFRLYSSKSSKNASSSTSHLIDTYLAEYLKYKHNEKQKVKECLEKAMKIDADNLYIKILKENPFLLYEKDKYGNTLLHRVIYDLNTRQTKLLVEKFYKTEGIDIQNNAGFTALHSAVLCSFYEGMDILLQNGANVNAETYYTNYSPLKFAIILENSDFIERLITAKADVHCETSTNQPLTIAVLTGNSQIVSRLLSFENLNLNLDFYTGSPLTYAISRRHDKIVKLLLEHGANPNQESQHTKERPLDVACKRGCSETFDLLLSYGADPAECNVPLTFSAAEQGNPDLVYELWNRYQFLSCPFYRDEKTKRNLLHALLSGIRTN